jgi:type I site-specific restriction endonuclease
MIDKKTLSERDICTKFITLAVEKSGLNRLTQLLEGVSFTDGKIYVRGKLSQKVIEAFLLKYADKGITNIESIEVLRVNPFDVYGSPVEIISNFGSKSNYLQAVKELEIELYKIA